MNLQNTSLSSALCLLLGAAIGLAAIAGANPADAAKRAPNGAKPTTGTPQPYPLSNGDAFVYAYSGSTTVAYPSATPSTVTYFGTVSQVDTCPVTFNGTSNLCDQQLVDSNELTSSTDYFYGYLPVSGSASQLNFYGTIEASIEGAYSETFTASIDPFSIYAVFPLARGERFNGDDDKVQEQSLTTGPQGYRSALVGTSPRNGGYRFTTKTTQAKLHTTTVALVRGDSSAQYVLNQTGYNPLTQTFGTPISVNGQEVIPVTTSGGNQLPATPPPATTVDVPDWFPGGGPPPHRLATEPTRYLGLVTVPTSCGSYAGSQAGDMHESLFELDPLEGYVVNAQFDKYLVVGVGDICDTEAEAYSYYDNLNTGKLLYTATYAQAQTLAYEDLSGSATTRRAWPDPLSRLTSPSRTSASAQWRPGGIDSLRGRGLRRNFSHGDTLGP